MYKDSKILERALFNHPTLEDICYFRVVKEIVFKEQYNFLKVIKFLEVPIPLSGVIKVIPRLSAQDWF